MSKTDDVPAPTLPDNQGEDFPAPNKWADPVNAKLQHPPPGPSSADVLIERGEVAA